MGANMLFPVFEVPEMQRESDLHDYKYRPSVKWDFEAGDFVLDGANRLVECDGIKAYITWCYKVVQTERFKCLAYPSEIGVEMDMAVREPDEKAVESAIERTITEALQVNPRTEYVRGFSFSWHGDSVKCSFTVKGKGTSEETLTVIL